MVHNGFKILKSSNLLLLATSCLLTEGEFSEKLKWKMELRMKTMIGLQQLWWKLREIAAWESSTSRDPASSGLAKQ